ncbi:MAG TPA: AAA family ATPase [Planctomycetota bacterium]|nr:AAA family ATPase [Planctomycetota bacterium]
MSSDAGATYTHEFLPDSEMEAAALTPRRALQLLRRRWVLFLGVWVLVGLGGFVVTRSLRPMYRAQSTLEVRPEKPLVSLEAPETSYVASLQLWANFYRTQESLLRSPVLILDVLRGLPESVAGEYLRRPDPAKAFADSLDIEKTESSFIMRVGFTDRDPARASTLVNALVSRYLDDANRRLRDLKNDTLAVLTKETLPAIQLRFDEADQALRKFQKDTGYADFEVEFGSRVENLRRVDTRLSEIRMKIFKMGADANALKGYDAEGVSGLYHEAFHGIRALEGLGTQRAALLDELAKQTGVLKEKHPRAIELKNELGRVEGEIRETVRGILQSFQKTLASLGEEEKQLDAEKARLEKDMADSRRHLTDFKRLDAELGTAKELYNSYLKKLSETRVAAGTAQGGVRIVDPASPPVEPHQKPNWILSLALVLGLILASASVWAAEQRGDELASPREVEVFLGLDVLGEIPAEERASERDPVLLPGDADSPAWEAYRGLRAHLLTRLEDLNRGKVILVTSPEEGEGKTTVATNLSRVLAMEDQRVLLIDGEFRWPVLKSLLADPMGTGLEEVLRGEMTLREAVQPSALAGVDILGADTGLLNAAEIPCLIRFQALLKAAKDLYDFVVIDSAPVNLASETALLGRRADATLLVVRQGRTRRGSARLGSKRLSDMKAAPLGAVVVGTGVPPSLPGYQNRRDPAREARILEKEGDNLVGIV